MSCGWSALVAGRCPTGGGGVGVTGDGVVGAAGGDAGTGLAVAVLEGGVPDGGMPDDGVPGGGALEGVLGVAVLAPPPRAWRPSASTRPVSSSTRAVCSVSVVARPSRRRL